MDLIPFFQQYRVDNVYRLIKIEKYMYLFFEEDIQV